MDRLMWTDPKQRLGAVGAGEVKAHPFLANIDWVNLFKTEASFVPSVTDPESTDYFDPRGATQVFHDDEDAPAVGGVTLASPRESKFQGVTTSMPSRSGRGSDDFGTFNFKNLPVLERANEEVIRRLKGDQAFERAKHLRHMSLGGQVKFLESDFANRDIRILTYGLFSSWINRSVDPRHLQTLLLPHLWFRLQR